MNSDNSWQKTLDDFLAEKSTSADTRVIARALSDKNKQESVQDDKQLIADLERALHIEQHLDEIGLQPIPQSLANKLETIGETQKSNNITFGKFTSNWKTLSAIAATITVVAVLNNTALDVPTNQQPTLAEIKQAEQELVIALQYIASAQTKSALSIKQTFDENIQRPLNHSLLKPLNHFKESS
jgi:anti-sigma-K factor RskA